MYDNNHWISYNRYFLYLPLDTVLLGWALGSMCRQWPVNDPEETYRRTTPKIIKSLIGRDMYMKFQTYSVMNPRPLLAFEFFERLHTHDLSFSCSHTKCVLIVDINIIVPNKWNTDNTSTRLTCLETVTTGWQSLDPNNQNIQMQYTNHHTFIWKQGVQALFLIEYIVSLITLSITIICCHVFTGTKTMTNSSSGLFHVNIKTKNNSVPAIVYLTQLSKPLIHTTNELDEDKLWILTMFRSNELYYSKLQLQHHAYF